MTLTVGTDSYISIDTADEYFNNTLNATVWDALIDATKEILLKEATLKLEAQQYIGWKQDQEQVLEFPRYFDYRYRSTDYDGTPREVQNACAEEALAIYNSQSDKILELKQKGVNSASFGNESISFGNNSYSDFELLSPKARLFINKWTAKGGFLA